MADDNSNQPSTNQPSDVQPSDVQPSDVQPSDVQPSDVQPSQMPPHAMPTGQRTAVLRPLGVTFVMVLCILAGVGGLLSGCIATAGLVLGETIAAMASADPDDPQMQLQVRMQETNRQMMIPNVIMTVFGAVLSGCFLAGGIGLLKTKPWSLKLIRQAILAGIVFECLRGAIVVWMQMKNGPIMERFYRELAEKNQGPDMSQMMVFIMWGGIAAWVLWAITKIALMVWGRIYLGGDAAKNYIAQMNA